MVLGIDKVWIELPSTDSSLYLNSGYPIKADMKGKLYQKVGFGKITEYDASGKTIWSWSSADYFRNSDIMANRDQNGLFAVDVHENSFFFDPVENVVYLSFRNVSRVLKVKYPAGEVLNTYGNAFEKGVKEMGNDLFCYQHCCGRMQNGNLYLFNNNDCHLPDLPKIIIMKQPATASGKLKKVWEFPCNVYPSTVAENKKRFKPGGNIIELPDHSLFSSVSCAFTAVFIVDQNKKVTWCGIPEFYEEPAKKWVMKYQYRASIIKSRKELERLIWNSVGQ